MASVVLILIMSFMGTCKPFKELAHTFTAVPVLLYDSGALIKTNV